jgi:hypothetical protein
VSAATRELAQRLTGTLEVVLLWHTDTNRLCVGVHDAGGGDHFQLEVAPAEAMDVFHHPYAYAAARGIRYCRHDYAGAETVDV